MDKRPVKRNHQAQYIAIVRREDKELFIESICVGLQQWCSQCFFYRKKSSKGTLLYAASAAVLVKREERTTLLGDLMCKLVN